MRLAFVAAVLLLTAGCATRNLQPVEASVSEPYRLGIGDRVRITTYGEAGLSSEFVIDGMGRIQFPLLGDIDVAGKTKSELRDDLALRIGKEYLRNPRVTVDVAAYRPAYVLGEVEKPGEIVYTEKMTAFALIAKAGGFTYRANRRVIFIRRENEPKEQPFPLAASLLIHPGDQVRVGETVF